MARNRQRARDRKQKKLHRENIPGSLDHASGEVDQVEAAIVAGAGGKPVEPAPDDVAAEPVDAVAPDAVKPDAVKPDAVKPDAVKPDEVKPEPVEPEPVAPDAVKPDAVEPDATKPKPKPKPRSRRRSKPEPVVEEPVHEPDDDDLDDEPYTEGDFADADAAAVEDERLGKGAGDVAVTPNAGKPAGFRLFNFFRACWAELQRVDWPDRRQVGQATAVVLGFVIVAGAFLGLADVIAQKIVDLII